MTIFPPTPDQTIAQMSKDTFLYKEQSERNVTSFKAPESLND